MCLLHKNNHHSSLPTPFTSTPHHFDPSLCATPRVLWTSEQTCADLARNHRSNYLMLPAINNPTYLPTHTTAIPDVPPRFPSPPPIHGSKYKEYQFRLRTLDYMIFLYGRVPSDGTDGGGREKSCAAVCERVKVEVVGRVGGCALVERARCAHRITIR